MSLGPSIVYRPDYQARAVAALVSAYRDKPRIRALVEAVASGAQDLEDRAFGLLTSTVLEVASGDLLDKWGALVGEARGALVNDDDYRVFIRARIRANSSTGTTDEFITIWQMITAPYVEVRHVDYYPAAFYLRVVRAEFMSDRRAARVGQMMRSIKPMGVAMDLVEASVGYLGFESDPDAYPLDRGLLARNL